MRVSSYIVLLSNLRVLTGLVTTQPAYRLSNGRQLLTSSTLSWADISIVQSSRIPADHVVVFNKSAVCRVIDGDKARPGSTDSSGLCLVDGIKERKYQVLVDVTGMARLEWREWDMFSNPTFGSVAYNENVFVGQMKVETGESVIGTLDYSRGLNGEIIAMIKRGKLETQTAGLALVELEPVRYQLENISFLASELKSSSPLTIGNVDLRSSLEDGVEWYEETGEVEYSYQSYEYWAPVTGTVRGLPAAVRLEGKVNHFTWGLPEEERRTKKMIVTKKLQPGTSLNITVTGLVVKKEIPYTAKLVMVYKDGAITSHSIASTLLTVLVENISQITEGPVYSKTGLPAPTTTKRPTTTTSSTTQSPTSNTSPPQAHMFLVPTPTPTLFPPAPPPVTKPNPLRQFYPETDYSTEELDYTVSDQVKMTALSSKSFQLEIRLLSLAVPLILQLYS